MTIDALDHLVIAVTDLSAVEPFQRLGLRFTPEARLSGGNANRVFFVPAAGGETYLEFLTGQGAGRGLTRLMFRTDNVDGMAERLAQAGVSTRRELVTHEHGDPICDVLRVSGETVGVANFAVLRYARDQDVRIARHRASGLHSHQFPLARLDHVAVLVTDLDAATAFWQDVLGVPLAGEFGWPGAIARQMTAGDVIVELIAADGPESRLAQMRPGLLPVAAFEVPDLDHAVALAKERGFSLSDPEPGVIPNTRRATIPGAEMGGIGVQLLEYV